MSRFLTSSAFALIATPLLAPAVSAQSATPEEAARITASLQSYFTATPDLVTVTPSGEAYALTVDFNVFIQDIPEGTGAASISPLNAMLRPLGEGRWDVTMDQSVAMSYEIPGFQTVNYEIGSLTSSAVWNEALFAFESAETTAEQITIRQKSHDREIGLIDVDQTIDSMQYRSTATANALDGVDSAGTMTVTGLHETFTLPAGAVPTTFTFTAPEYTFESQITGLRTAALGDLLAFGITQIGSDLPPEEETKAKLRAALPVFDNLKASGVVPDIAVASDFGSLRADRMAIEIEMNGVVDEGHLREAIFFEGLTLPTEIIPTWAHPLLPENLALDFTVQDFDLAAVTSAALDAVSFETGLPPEVEATLPMLALPDGGLTVTLNGTGVSNADYDLQIDGNMLIGLMGLPTGTGKVSLTGIDAITEMLGNAPEEVSAGALPGLAMVRGMSTAEGDAAVWNIEGTPDGKLLVNGMDISPMLQ